MVEFVILNVRPLHNLLLLLVVIFPTRFVEVFFCFVLFRLNRLWPNFYQLSGHISSNFMRNIVFMFSFELHKTLKI